MAKAIQNETVAQVVVAQQQSALKAEQDAVCAQAGIDFKTAFAVPCAKIGNEIREQLADAVSAVAEKVAKIHVMAGLPEEYAADVVEAVAESMNPHAGLSDVAKAIGGNAYLEATGEELPATFWSKEAPKAETVPVAALAVSLDDM